MFKLVKSAFLTERLDIKNNHLKPAKFQLKPILRRSTGKINETTFFTTLTLAIESTEANPFPVDLHVDFKGIFEFKDIENEGEITSYLQTKAVELMYPYLRSMVSGLTVTAMLPPIILPIINIVEVFKKANQETAYIN